MQDIVTVISVITAFAAVVVSYLSARQGIRATVVSSNRQVWINSLRDTIAEYLAKAMMARTLNALEYAGDSSLPRVEEILRLNTRIELLINPKEKDHAQLARQVSQMTDALNSQNPKNQAFDVDSCRKQIVELSQLILKREWDRVKAGD
jgi:hypothetical protein